MKLYLYSLLAGVLVGVIYAVIGVRSPAPPIIALIGLLGILIGEQIPPLIKQFGDKDGAQVGWFNDQVKPHIFGHLPRGNQQREHPEPTEKTDTIA
jgi:XapX domain-containing protein